MICPRCKKQNSYQLTFYFEKKKVKLQARVCRVCEFIYAEDDELLKAARSHLKELTKWQQPNSKKSNNSQKKNSKTSSQNAQTS